MSAELPRVLTALLQAWNDHAPFARFPAARELTPLRLHPWLPNLVFIDLQPTARKRFHVRLMGAHLAEALGHDLTGTNFDAGGMVTGQAARLRPLYLCLFSGRPIYTRTPGEALGLGGGIVDQLTLPCRGKGHDIAHLIVAGYPTLSKRADHRTTQDHQAWREPLSTPHGHAVL